MTQRHIIVQREVLINAPLAHVWPLVATEEGLCQWWGNKIVLEAKEGGRCEEWRSERERASHWQGVVTIYTPPHHLMMTLRAQGTSQDSPELATISIALEARGEQTRVHVTHRAFGPADAIATGDQRDMVEIPEMPHEMPMAQLVRPAPGTLPTQTPHYGSGRIAPADSFNRQSSDALIFMWQQRLTTLIASAQAEAQ